MAKPLAPLELEKAFYEINRFRQTFCGVADHELGEITPGEYIEHRREHIAEALAEAAHYIHANNSFRPLFTLSLDDLTEKQRELFLKRVEEIRNSGG